MYSMRCPSDRVFEKQRKMATKVNKENWGEKGDLEGRRNLESQKLVVMKHDAHPLLLNEVSALFVGWALSTLDMNLVDVCVSIARPVVQRACRGQTGRRRCDRGRS